jgi:hypothetical protein
MLHHDIIHWMLKEWDSAFRGSALSQQRDIGEWSKQVTVRYEDFNEQIFEATMEFVLFTVRHTLKESHGNDWPKTDDKTWEIRNVKFRKVSAAKALGDSAEN